MNLTLTVYKYALKIWYLNNKLAFIIKATADVDINASIRRKKISVLKANKKAVLMTSLKIHNTFPSVSSEIIFKSHILQVLCFPNNEAFQNKTFFPLSEYFSSNFSLWISLSFTDRFCTRFWWFHFYPLLLLQWDLMSLFSDSTIEFGVNKN